MKDSISPLLSSINVSLLNKQIFALPYKTGFTWGQMVVDEEFVSYIGICFNESLGKEDEIEIDLYNEGGLFKTINYTLNPGSSLIISSEDLRAEVNESRFIWYVAKSKRPDLSAHSFHVHKLSHNSSGEHSF